MAKVIIAGATGLVGEHVLSLLCKDNRISSITVLARRQPPFNSAKTSFVKTDFSCFQKISDTYDWAFCCLGSTRKKAGSRSEFIKVDLEYVYQYAKYCKSIGVKNFAVVSSFGADRKSLFFYFRVKGEMESQLASLGFDRLLIYRPSLLIGKRHKARFMEGMLQKFFLLSQKILGPFRCFLGTKVSDLSYKMVSDIFINHPEKKVVFTPKSLC